MAKPADNLSTLFRALGPDSGSLQPAPNVALQDAEQRWPLLKAMPPRRQDAPPALSAEERQCWSRSEAAPSEPRKPALSLPSLSSKLAQSLSKMGAPKLGAPTPGAPTPGAPKHAPAALPEPAARVERAAAAEAKRAEPEPAAEAPAAFFAALEQADEPAKPELFNKNTQQPAAAEPEAAPAAGGSLAGIFARLEGPDESAAKPPPRRPSFLDRWAKR